MNQGLANSPGRWIAAIIAVAAAAWLCYAGVKHGVAGHYAASTNADDWSRASSIEPANGENWYRLGRYRELDFDHSDIPLAISYYRRAVQLNPRSSFYKLDLASALEMSGENVEAEQYFRAAQAGYPISAEVSWKYGNFLLRQQRLPEAYAEIRRACEVDPKLIPLAVSRAWRSNPDISVLLDQALPNTVEAEWGALSFLTDEHEATAALAVWNRVIARKPAIDRRATFLLINMLVAQEHFNEAGSVWRQSTGTGGTSTSGSPSSNDGSLVFDGGFENDPSGGGFGWRQEDVYGAAFEFDTVEKHSGARSAEITFDGTQNLAYGNLYQEVLVTPGTHYLFRGWLRTDQISTDSGVRFEIFDPKDLQSLNVLTPSEKGTQSWTLAEADFTPGPKTHVIRVQVTRVPSERLDNKISGNVWIDDVAIVPVASQK